MIRVEIAQPEVCGDASCACGTFLMPGEERVALERLARLLHCTEVQSRDCAA